MDGAIIALNLNTGQYYTLNETGTRMWTLLADLGSLDDTVGAIEAEYDVTRDRASRDLTGLIEDLMANDLIEVA
ncbi:unnamed protein product [marine sediment metagenome]|uniref:Coenzyme PQQ synthesis protein D (PqqD) n=1 Tax=marine sediment metagenome TaxID=412755 RepID=X1G0X4_9ZZZZ